MRKGTGSYVQHVLLTKKGIVGYLCIAFVGKDHPDMFPLKFGYRNAVISDRLRRKGRTPFCRDNRVASDVRIV